MYNLMNFAQDHLTQGLVKTFQEESVIFDLIPVLNITGNSIAYNMCHELFEIEKRQLGEDVVNIQELTTEKVVEPLEIYSTSARVDRAMCLMASEDLLAIETQLQGTAMARALEKAILNKAKSVAGVKVTPKGAMPTVDEVAEAMDVMHYIPNETILVCNGKTGRNLMREATAQGFTNGKIELFGKTMDIFNGVPVKISKDLNDGEVLVMHLNSAQGLSLVTNKGVQAYNRGLVGVNYVTDMELLASVVVKNTKSVAYISK